MLRRFLFLVAAFLLLGASAHAQKAEAYKFATISSIRSSKKICDAYVALDAKLRQDHKLQGYIFLYGRPAVIRAEKRELLRCMTWRDYDPSRITLVEAPPKAGIMIVMWIIPPGAETPDP